MRLLLAISFSILSTQVSAESQSECNKYALSAAHSEMSISLARGIAEGLPVKGSSASHEHVAEYSRMRKETPDVESDPVFFLAWAYRFALSNEHGVSLALAEEATRALIEGNFCEEKVIFSLVSSLRYQVSSALLGDTVPGYLGYGANFHTAPVDFRIDNFNAAVCWMQNMSENLSPIYKRLYARCIIKSAK